METQKLRRLRLVKLKHQKSKRFKNMTTAEHEHNVRTYQKEGEKEVRRSQKC